MIVDHISNLEKYVCINPHIKTIVDYINSHDLMSIEGKHIINEDVYLIREDYVPKSLHECQFEAHKVYADIQIVLDGTEIFGYLEKNDLKFQQTQAYDQSKDVLKGMSLGYFSTVLLTKGMFAMVLKEELHLPKLTAGLPSEVKKAVFKFKI